MSRHLKVDKWFHKMPSGKLKRKRVSSSLAKQFPIKLRVIYQKHGVRSLVNYLRKADNSTLSAAWSKVKMMFNGSSGTYAEYQPQLAAMLSLEQDNGSGDTVQLEIDDTLVTASAITYEGTPVNMTDYAYGGHEDILQVLGY